MMKGEIVKDFPGLIERFLSIVEDHYLRHYQLEQLTTNNITLMNKHGETGVGLDQAISRLMKYQGCRNSARKALVKIGHALAIKLERQSENSVPLLSMLDAALHGGGPPAVHPLWPSLKVGLQQIAIRATLQADKTNQGRALIEQLLAGSENERLSDEDYTFLCAFLNQPGNRLSLSRLQRGEADPFAKLRLIQKYNRNLRKQFLGKEAGEFISTPGQNKIVTEQDNQVEPTYLFSNEGAVYRISFDVEKGTIPTNLKGAKYIFEMLQKPNKIFLANELHALVAGMDINTTDEGEPSRPQEPQKRRCGADKGELFDLRRQLGKANAGLQRAKDDYNNVEETHCQEEIEALNKRIREMTGLGGKLRRTDISESLGKTVSKSIDLIIKKCKENYNLPKLAAHLDGSIDRGRSCSYRPANPIPDWKF